MSGGNTVDDIVQDFVNNDLASLDNIAGTSESFTLSPNLAEKSPSLIGEETINIAKRGPPVVSTKRDEAASPAVQSTEAAAASTAAASTATAASVAPSTGSPSKSPSQSSLRSPKPLNKSGEEDSKLEKPAEPRTPRIQQPGANNTQKPVTRNFSTSSSTSTSSDGKSKGFFKSLGKRITSSGKK